MLLRDRVSRWLAREGPWRFTVLVNSVIMTLFLWHMTAYLVAILLLWPLGLGHSDATQLRWWLERPIWILVPGAVLLAIIAVFGRFERPATLRKTATATTQRDRGDRDAVGYGTLGDGRSGSTS
jgi:hypothetical protein